MRRKKIEELVDAILRYMHNNERITLKGFW